MTKKEIDRAYQTTQKFLSGSISYENLIKDLRGTDIITVVILVILFNWYNSFFEPVAGFVPPHMDPIGWLTNKYDNSHQNQSQAYPPSRFERSTLHKMNEVFGRRNLSGFFRSYRKS